MVDVEVKWQRQSIQGVPLEQWTARLVHPMRSREFAWLVRRDGLWLLELWGRDLRIRPKAYYASLDKAKRHVERWIATRWRVAVPEEGASDPRGFEGRMPIDDRKHLGATQVRDMELARRAREAAGRK